MAVFSALNTLIAKAFSYGAYKCKYPEPCSHSLSPVVNATAVGFYFFFVFRSLETQTQVLGVILERRPPTTTVC